MSLQVYYVGISIYGWYKWSGRAAPGKKKEELKVSRLNSKTLLTLLLIFLVLWLGICQVLIHYTDSQLPVMDALTTAGSIIATWMLARKILEHWLLWIVIDAISIGLYFYKELYATVVLFIVYTVVAVMGYFAWKKVMTLAK